ncbi:MAG TPA: DUF2267 domain-containing protein [Egibacteraceae bacterium]|nr:DUF2267 domain-containing protein [Actinomycetota bacterium]HWB71597.1 DUF2267 domain-containing protein [Egibacteraceae bacterium]
MDHDEFIGHVQHRARLDSRGAAEQTTRATLETLAERLAGGEPKDLAAQLPDEIGRHLRRTEAAQESFSLQDFYQRVAERSAPGVGLPDAAFHAKAVLSVVRDAVSPGQFDHLVAQLPDEYRDLLAYDEATS